MRIGTTRGLESKTFTYEDVEKNPAIMDEFMSVMEDTSNRNEFVQRNGEYITHLMKVFADCCDITMVYYNKKVDCDLEKERQSKKAELLASLETAPEKKIKGIKGEDGSRLFECTLEYKNVGKVENKVYNNHFG